MTENLVTRNDAATYASVTPRTISRWAATGLITTYKSRSGHVHYDLREVARVIEPAAVSGPAAEGPDVPRQRQH